MSDSLEARKVALEGEFNTLKDEDTKLVTQMKALTQRRTAIRERQLQLSGAFQELNALLNPAKPLPEEAPAEVAEEEKSSKKK
jgi:predicted  nucleic acid-binding Zn-ribbon protein